MCCICCTLYTLQGQENRKIAFSKIENGLFNEWVSAITQDSLGFIWVGTQDGLHRFDGYKFEIIRNSPEELQSPAANWIRDIAIDSNQDYWLATDGGGLSKFSANDMTFINFEADSLGTSQGKQVYKVASLSEHQVLSSSEEGFHIYDIRTKESKRLEIWGGEFAVTGLKNKIWISNRNTLFIYDRDKQDFKIFKNYDSNISFLHHIPKVGTLVGLSDRLLLYNKTQEIGQIALEETLHHIASDGKGTYVMASSNKLYGFNSALFQLREIPMDLETQNKNIESIFLDRQGSLWVGTDKGLFKEKKYNPSFLSEPIEVHARSILKHDETLFLGGIDGLLMASEGNLTSIIKNKSIQSIRIVGDTVLASTYSSEILRIWKDQPLDTLVLPGPTDANTGIFGITTDSRGRLWMGTKEGLSVYNGKTQEFKHIPLEKEGKIQIVNIYLDKKDRLWVVTSGNGIYKINDLSNSMMKTALPPLVNYRNIRDENNSPTSNIIITVEEDDQGQLWFGTDIGVVKYLEESDDFSRLQYENQLFDKKVMSLVKDDDQNLWITTISNGIYVFNVIKKTIRHFTVYDGLISNAFLHGSAYFDENSKTMFLGTDSGVQQIDLSKPFSEENNTFPVITAFQVNSTSQNNTFTAYQVPYLKDIELEAAQNDFSVSFSGMDFIAPEKIEFSYTLDDKLWKVTDLQTAYFTNIPYGKHTLKVKTLYDGIPNNKNIGSLNIYIAPPWFLSRFAKAFYIVLFLAALWGIYRYQKWRWRMKFNLQLKEEEAERLQKLNNFKSNLYTNIAHEFKTPLTLISGPIDQKLTQGNLSDFDHANFSIVKRNTARLTTLVDQLLELSRLEDGKINFQLSKGNLSLFLHTISQSFEYQAYLKNIDFVVEIDALGEVWYDEDIVEKITTNLLSNALKYSPEEGSCSFLVKRKEHMAQIHVKNIALNASKLELDKLFTRFYQYDSYSEGMGVGLSLVKELVNVYGGTIQASLEENDVLHFRVELPILKTAFEKDAIIEIQKNLKPEEPISNVLDVDYELSEETKEAFPIVLIVEDHKEVRTFIKLALQSKYRILEAENGKIGMEIALSQIPDIVLSDIRMPVQNGIQLCNALKTDERTSHIPVILLTASIGEEDELKGLTSGADDFVKKPFKINILEKRIANLIAVRRALRDRYRQELILKPKDIAVTPSDVLFLNRIQQILDENLSDPEFNAAVFIKKAKMSRMQLHRKLKLYTGLSASAFIRSQRLNQALNLLKTSKLSINEIAYTIGFNTPTYFMKCFKETFGSTPSEYLKNMDKK